MKNRYLLFAVAVLFSIITSSALQAQAVYIGGEGGGYASHSVAITTSVIIPDTLAYSIFDVTIFPNPVKRDDVFKAKFTGTKSGEKVKIILNDMIGSRLLIEEIEITNEYEISLPYDRMTKGIYLITFQHNNQKITRRFSLTQ